MAVGDAASKAVLKILEQRARALDELSAMMAKILSNLSERADFTGETNDGIETLLKHLKNGGKIDTTMVAKEDTEMLDEILRANKLPYVMAYDSASQSVFLMTRDKDRSVLEDVLKQYGIRKGTELQEIEISDFLKAYDGKEIRIEKNLDAATIELFREKAKQYNCTYSVTTSTENPGKFELVYPREKEKDCDNALKDVAYDFSGEEGRIYKEKLTQNIEKREEFKKNLRPIGDETVIICPKDDPTRFLAVTRDGFSVHDIQTMREKLKDGESNIRLVDKNTAVYNTFDKEKLGKYLDLMKEPVLLSMEEFGLLKGISISGKASFIKDSEFKDKYKKLTEALLNKEASYPALMTLQKEDKKEKIISYENLLGSQIDQIEDALQSTGLSKYLVQGQDADTMSLAFPERFKDEIVPVIEEVLYKDSQEAERLQKELLYKGRGTLDIHKAEDIVIDINMPGVALFFEKDYMSIVQKPTEEEKLQGKKNIPLEKIYRDDPEYDKKVTDVISSMKEVVVLDKDEYRQKQGTEGELSKLIRSRMPSEHKTDAEVEYDKFIEAHNKSMYEALHNQINDVDHIDELNERQQEAVHAHYSRSYEDIYVNRSTFEKVSTLDFSDRKFQRTEMHEQTQETTR